MLKYYDKIFSQKKEAVHQRHHQIGQAHKRGTSHMGETLS